MKITLSKLRKLNACYTDEQMLTVSGGKKSMELIDIMRLDIPEKDRIWVACACMPQKMRLEFSYTVASRALSRVKNPDQRSVSALAELRKYIDGQSTTEKMREAADAAYAAYYATNTAYTAYYAADAAYYAARSASRSAARSASYSAAYSAARSASYSAARSAEERKQQIEDIIRLLEGEERR
jgi:hypothetical protein